MNILVTIEAIQEQAHSPHNPTRPADLRVIDGKPWVEYVIDTLPAADYGQFTFLVQESCQRMFFLAELIRLHRPEAQVLIIPDGARGPVCSVLMACEGIATDELCIIQGNQFLRQETQQILDDMRRSGSDAAAVTFDSLHPRWPHIQLADDGEVLEVSETSLLSRSALAGIYYFRSGADFIRSAEQIIRKDNHVQGRFGLASTLNELILAGKSIHCHAIPSDDFVPLCTDSDFANLPRLEPAESRQDHSAARIRVYAPAA